MTKTGIIIQARMGSSRLPGKVLSPIGNRVLLQHLVDRIHFLNQPLPFVIATSLLPQDDVIEQFCEKNRWNIFRGDHADVLDRYLQCADKFQFNSIVRLTADNPFWDYLSFEEMYSVFLKRSIDYIENFKALPVGLGSEIISYQALKKSHEVGDQSHHREHVNEYIQENPQIFSTIQITEGPWSSYNQLRLTVDTPKDLERARYICHQFPQQFPIKVADIIPTAIKFDQQVADKI